MTDPSPVNFDSFFVYTDFFMAYDPPNPYAQFRNRYVTPRMYRLAVFGRVLMWTWLLSLCCAEMAEFYFNVIGSANLLLITESLAWIMVGGVCLATNYTFWKQGDRLTALLRTLHQMYPTAAETQADIDVAHELQGLVNVMGTFEKMWFYTMGLKVSVPVLRAFVLVCVRGAWKFQLALTVYYPFDPYDNRFVAFVYVYESVGTVLSTIAMMATSSLFAGVVTQLSIQFKLLIHDIERLRPRRETRDLDLEALSALIRRHNLLIDFCVELRDVFSKFLFANYFLCSIGMSMFLFVLVTQNNAEIIAEYVGDVICFTAYIGTLSFYGDKLIELVW